MKRDAFDDVSCPFNYAAELQKAREALNTKVGTYISENPAAGYREISKRFGISSATLCAIAKKHSRKRKPGRTSRGRKITFDVRHKILDKEFMTRVTVMAADVRSISVASMRNLVATYYKTTDIKSASDMKAERQAGFTVRELEQLIFGASAPKKRLP
jgi:hypothetical protein